MTCSQRGVDVSVTRLTAAMQYIRLCPQTAAYHDCEFGEQNATNTSTSVASTNTTIRFLGGVVIGYIHVAVETVAVLSWLAGFIAVVVQ
ncbi:hypothetical protein BHYA_0345g00030 [Botrytis hyacinthi]|uniref:Uncharacterized protein n=1 Tax=Botrytis hyacinthi TaxID=278943 RepID=A0A4Z1GAR4_9HELO|nr:hypothetical protein BHYA_0345g00030 [Botrytis hyacinthi]